MASPAGARHPEELDEEEQDIPRLVAGLVRDMKFGTVKLTIHEGNVTAVEPTYSLRRTVKKKL